MDGAVPNKETIAAAKLKNGWREGKTPTAVATRWATWRELYETGKYSLAGIAKATNVDHTTVINAKRNRWKSVGKGEYKIKRGDKRLRFQEIPYYAAKETIEDCGGYPNDMSFESAQKRWNVWKALFDKRYNCRAIARAFNIGYQAVLTAKARGWTTRRVRAKCGQQMQLGKHNDNSTNNVDV